MPPMQKILQSEPKHINTDKYFTLMMKLRLLEVTTGLLMRPLLPLPLPLLPLPLLLLMMIYRTWCCASSSIHLMMKVNSLTACRARSPLLCRWNSPHHHFIHTSQPREAAPVVTVAALTASEEKVTFLSFFCSFLMSLSHFAGLDEET